MKALVPLLGYLSPLGVLPVEEPVALGPVEELLASYRRYLLVERGLTVGTARGYVDNVRPFVATRLRGSTLELAVMHHRATTSTTTGLTHPHSGRRR